MPRKLCGCLGASLKNGIAFSTRDSCISAETKASFAADFRGAATKHVACCAAHGQG